MLGKRKWICSYVFRKQNISPKSKHRVTHFTRMIRQCMKAWHDSSPSKPINPASHWTLLLYRPESDPWYKGPTTLKSKGQNLSLNSKFSLLYATKAPPFAIFLCTDSICSVIPQDLTDLTVCWHEAWCVRTTWAYVLSCRFVSVYIYRLIEPE